MTPVATIAVMAAIAVLVIAAFAYISSNNHGQAPTTVRPARTVNTSQPNATTTISTLSSTSTISAPSNQAAAPSTPTGQSQFIVYSPVNLTQISAISKFRSCSGHDYSGYDVNGTLETNSSMKHYFSPSSQYKYTTGKIEEFAPFNGTITTVQSEQTPIGHQVWVADSTSGAVQSFNGQTYPTPGIWTAIFFHMDLVNGLGVGSKVTAGQLIGYANQSMNEQTFDIALSKFMLTNGTQMQGKEILDSIFNHMSQQVLGQFAAYGANQSDMIISQASRAANPCTFNMYHAGDWVNLTKG